ncbi:MAG: sigma-70 family RNA polymerase sigma factor [Planctomycetota bacterium]|jgi:RNA polymerase sigma factor for flagellar operon FliA
METDILDHQQACEQTCLKAAASKAYGGQKQRCIDDDQITQYLPMVHKIVNRTVTYLQPSLSVEDLVSAGTIGLIKAARDYDSSRDAEFKTYAYIRIRGAVLDELKSQSFVPAAVNKQIREAAKLRTDLTEERGIAPSDEELADKMNISVDKLYRTYENARAKQFVSIDGSSSDEDTSLLGSLLTAAATPSPSSRMEQAELIEKLTEAITELDQRQREIIVLYYQQELTMKQIAEVFNITEPRVSQLHAKALFSLSVKLGQYRDGG